MADDPTFLDQLDLSPMKIGRPRAALRMTSITVAPTRAPALRRPAAPVQTRAVSEPAPDYAFPHSAADESRRLELFEQRLD